MKSEPIQVPGKNPRDRFFELGRKIMSAPKDEIDAREKQWRARKRRKKR